MLVPGLHHAASDSAVIQQAAATGSEIADTIRVADSGARFDSDQADAFATVGIPLAVTVHSTTPASASDHARLSSPQPPVEAAAEPYSI